MSAISKVQQPADQLNIDRIIINLSKNLLRWGERIKQRKQLVEMDERLLKDIGISRYDALVEARKPFWKV